MKWNRIEAGWYATPDGRWAAVSDGYESIKSVGADGDYEGFQGGEWCAVHDHDGRLREDSDAGEHLNWFPTKREAVDECERLAGKAVKA